MSRKFINSSTILVLLAFLLSACFTPDPLMEALALSDWQQVYALTSRRDRRNDIVAQRIYLKACMQTNRSYLTPREVSSFEFNGSELANEEKWHQWTKKALAENPNHPIFLYLYADGMALHVGRLDVPLKYYSMAIAMDAEFTLAYADRARLYLRLSKDDLERADHQRAMSLSENNCYVYISWAIACRDFDEAIENFNAALQINPNHIDALTWRSEIWWVNEEYDKAIPDLERALKISNWDPNLAYWLGRLYRILGENHKSIDINNEIIDRATPSDSAYKRLAGIAIEQMEHGL